MPKSPQRVRNNPAPQAAPNAAPKARASDNPGFKTTEEGRHQRAAKMLTDNFKGWGPEAMDVRKVRVGKFFDTLRAYLMLMLLWPVRRADRAMR